MYESPSVRSIICHSMHILESCLYPVVVPRVISYLTLDDVKTFFPLPVCDWTHVSSPKTFP